MCRPFHRSSVAHLHCKVLSPSNIPAHLPLGWVNLCTWVAWTVLRAGKAGTATGFERFNVNYTLIWRRNNLFLDWHKWMLVRTSKTSDLPLWDWNPPPSRISVWTTLLSIAFHTITFNPDSINRINHPENFFCLEKALSFRGLNPVDLCGHNVPQRILESLSWHINCH